MAMTLPIAIPATPSAGNSPASDDSSNPPRTPVSPSNPQTLALPSANEQQQQSSATPPASQVTAHPGTTQMKRKPSRRANTAERRATHNAVERQRRETLNGRFLDLAALLPNLSQIRRPSKSSIVNSSIAHVHAARRHRLLAARELRLLTLEADALRRELNEWRDRAGLPRVDEPVRGEGFAMVLSGELEVLAAVPGEEEEENPDEYGDDDYPTSNNNNNNNASVDDVAISMLKNASNPFTTHAHGGHGLAGPALSLAHILPRSQQAQPMIASPTSVSSFENPAMAALYEPHTQGFPNGHFIPQQEDKWSTQQLYSALAQQQQRGMFTPPASAHGLGGQQFGNATDAFFPNFGQQQQQQGQGQRGMYIGSPTTSVDDASSVGSSGRERSGSVGHGSGFGSPGSVGTGSAGSEGPGSFEMPSVMGEYGARRFGGDGMMGMGGVGVSAMGRHGHSISVGGGGSGNGFAMMM